MSLGVFLTDTLSAVVCVLSCACAFWCSVCFVVVCHCLPLFATVCCCLLAFSVFVATVSGVDLSVVCHFFWCAKFTLPLTFACVCICVYEYYVHMNNQVYRHYQRVGRLSMQGWRQPARSARTLEILLNSPALAFKVFLDT